MLDLRDLIRRPEKYLVDGQPLLSAMLKLRTLDGPVLIHRHDHGLQERRVTLAAGVQPSQAHSQEVIAEQFIAQMIDRGPEPLRRLADWLSKVLDEDDWETAERLLLGAYEATADSGVKGSDHG